MTETLKREDVEQLLRDLHRLNLRYHKAIGSPYIVDMTITNATQALRAFSEPTPEALEAWAEWFDDPNKSPSMSISLVTTGGALPQATPGYLLREIARRLRAADPTGPR